MTIREFIELQQEIYNLPPETFAKIKVKVSRELQKMDSWFELDEKTKVAKTSAFVLTEDMKNTLTIAMKPYFLKISGIDQNDFEREKKKNSIRVKNLDSYYHFSDKDDKSAYIFDIPRDEKMCVMIEALFSRYFELDEETWKDDYTNYNLFLDDEEALLSDSLALSNMRLKQPLRFYVQQKNKEKEQ